MSIIGPTLTKLQIVSNSSTRLSIRVNGEELAPYDGLPIPLDPGESVVEAAAPGREPWRKSVNADDLGATIVIEVPDLRPVPPPAPPPPLAPRPLGHDHQPPGERPLDLRLPAAVLTGAGAASIIVGTIFGVSARNNYDDSNGYCRANHCTQPGIDLRDRAYDKAAVSTATVGLGLVAVATGVVLWLTSPSQPPGPTRSQRATAAVPRMLISADGFAVRIESDR
jgi:hypothetical protein